jgi:hypothetical protein
LKPKFELLNNPMTVDISVQTPDIQMELCNLQADCFIQSKINLPPRRVLETVFARKIPNITEFFS